MNWYRKSRIQNRLLTKYAQIWITQLNTFSDYLRALYELEYKYSMITSKPFTGLPERQQNIAQSLEKELADVLYRIQNVLLPLFKTWLAGHAITKPLAWAQARMNDAADLIEAEGSKYAVEGVVTEYNKYVLNRGEFRYSPYSPPNYESIFSKMLNEATKNLSRFPNLKRLIDLYLTDYKESERNELYSSGIEEFGSRYNKTFKTQEQAEAFINRLNLNYIDLDTLMGDGMDSFATALDNNGLTHDVLTEFYKNLVFPAWFAYWGAMGIKDTRKNIENIYKLLLKVNVKDIKNAIAVISMALNATHQTGDMLDYLEDHGEFETESGDAFIDLNPSETRDLLDELSGGSQVEEWNTELREIGVQI